ncbi:MAG: isopenicillin N synthase family oxygenase, partial [Euryarchaeota archaeon]|nr:isopenicillin N synthase family oxygenase [Euryarchaeota archaeon]
ISKSYLVAEDFFQQPQEKKNQYEQAELFRQRGYTPYGVEHAKDNPAPDLKEFWQTGRSIDDPDFHKNIWPSEPANFEQTIDGLYVAMESMSSQLLAAASLYLNKPEKWLPSMSENGNTILRVIHYPPLGEDSPEGAVRSAQHEDINLITLLVGATADGLQVMDHDGTWIEVEGNHEHIIVDSGDMLQNLTNGLFKSTTHRVINPPDARSDRYSMPMFVHPRNEVDLTPLPEFVALTGGEVLYGSINAGDYLHQRLVEIGLAS